MCDDRTCSGRFRSSPYDTKKLFNCHHQGKPERVSGCVCFSPERTEFGGGSIRSRAGARGALTTLGRVERGVAQGKGEVGG